MSRDRCGALRAYSGQHKTPNWEPLVAAVEGHLAGGFMWMAEHVLEDGTRVQNYKHVHTRRYLSLSDGPRAYAETPCGGYKRQRLDYAIESAICSWWILSEWTEADRQAVITAVSSIPEEEHDHDQVDQLFT